jgi:hypothetical protein
VVSALDSVFVFFFRLWGVFFCVVCRFVSPSVWFCVLHFFFFLCLFDFAFLDFFGSFLLGGFGSFDLGVSFIPRSFVRVFGSFSATPFRSLWTLLPIRFRRFHGFSFEWFTAPFQRAGLSRLLRELLRFSVGRAYCCYRRLVLGGFMTSLGPAFLLPAEEFCDRS